MSGGHVFCGRLLRLRGGGCRGGGGWRDDCSRAEVKMIKGHKRGEFARLLKVETYWDEVIHRDDLVVEV